MHVKIHRGNFIIPHSACGKMGYCGYSNLSTEGGTLLLSKNLGATVFKGGSITTTHNFENLQKKVSNFKLAGTGIHKKKSYINFKI